MIVIKNELANYKTSRDYKRLAGLAKKASIICFVSYMYSKVPICKDYLRIGKSFYIRHESGNETYKICCNGETMLSAKCLEDFLCQCENSNVEFIDPEEAPEETGNGR
jgi:hypothetical protein